MKALIFAALAVALVGCSSFTAQDRWKAYADAHKCEPTGRQKVLLAGSVYTIPQRRKVYEFNCETGKVWSDLGNYTRHNEWLSI